MTKPSKLFGIVPIVQLVSLGGGGGTIDADTGLPPSGQIPTATGSNTWAWGSNVAIITSNSSNQLLGPFVNFQSGTGIAFAAASNTLTISSTISGGGGGAAATDPTIPVGGTLYDGTSTSGWTTFGASLTFDVTTVAGHFYLQKTTMGAGETVGVYRAVGGSFPRTYTMKITDAWMWADFQGVGPLLGEAAPGKLLTLPAYRNGVSKLLQRILWTNATTVSSQVDVPTSQDHHTRPPIWLRFVVNSSTDIEGWVSFGGLLYYRAFAAYNPSMTVGVFGFAMSTFAAIEMKAAVDWIHES